MKRKLICVTVFFIFVGMVVAKQKFLINKRSRPIESIEILQQSNGRPVIVDTIQFTTVYEKELFTARRSDNGTYKAYITKTLKERLAHDGCVFFEDEGQKIPCEFRLAADIDISTGLYLIEVFPPDKAVFTERRIIFSSYINPIENACLVKNLSVDMTDGVSSIYFIENGRAKKQAVKNAKRMEEGIVITDKEFLGQEYVREGIILLHDGDRVKRVEEEFDV
jgi:hypothetical protein